MIYFIKNKILSSNTYLLSNTERRTCIIIDPGFDENLIDNKIQKLKLKPIAIIATHGHFDHIASASFFKNKYKIPFYLHEADLKLSQSANFYLKVTKFGREIITPKPDFLLKGNLQAITIGGFDLNVYNFAGHTNGSCVIQFENNLFSGDIMYKKGLWFNSLPGENKIKLSRSISAIFNMFANDFMLYPGHGESDYLGKIKSNNLELLDFLSKSSTENV